jgi:hypothetical protein
LIAAVAVGYLLAAAGSWLLSRRLPPPGAPSTP